MQQREVKIVLLGDSGYKINKKGVGKSSLLYRFVMNNFDQNQSATIGAAFMSKSIIYENINMNFKFYYFQKIWDTAGQEKYHSLASLYYRGQNIYYKDAQVAIVVFDVNNKESYDNMKNWIDELQQYAKNIIIVIAANKSDLLIDNYFDSRELDNYVQSIKSVYKLTSAKNDIGIEDIFIQIAQKVSQIKDVSEEDEIQISQIQNKIIAKKKCDC